MASNIRVLRKVHRAVEYYWRNLESGLPVYFPSWSNRKDDEPISPELPQRSISAVDGSAGLAEIF
jgi:hypothetical protein